MSSYFRRACLSILDWFAAARPNEALMGDLIEEVQSGRSNWWLLRQVAIAIARSTIDQIAGNKMLSFRAVCTGLLVAAPLTALSKRLVYFSWGDGPLQYWLFTCLAFGAAGALLQFKFPSHRAAAVVAFTFYALIAKGCLVALNIEHFSSSSNPLRLPSLAAATMLTPLCTIPGALAFRRFAQPASRAQGDHGVDTGGSAGGQVACCGRGEDD